MSRGKCDRKGRSMVERLLLYVRENNGATRRDMERYIWRMQGQPRSGLRYSLRGWTQPGHFRYHQVKWTIFGPIKRLRYREAWGTNLSSLNKLGWLVKGQDGKWHVPPEADIRLPIYTRSPGQEPPPRSPPYRPEDHYNENYSFWSEL